MKISAGKCLSSLGVRIFAGTCSAGGAYASKKSVPRSDTVERARNQALALEIAVVCIAQSRDCVGQRGAGDASDGHSCVITVAVDEFPPELNLRL